MTLIRWAETVSRLVAQHEAGELEVATGPRYLTLSEQSALLTFAAHTLANQQARTTLSSAEVEQTDREKAAR